MVIGYLTDDFNNMDIGVQAKEFQKQHRGPDSSAQSSFAQGSRTSISSADEYGRRDNDGAGLSQLGA